MSKPALEKILETLSESGLALSPSDLAFNLDYSSGHVARVCGEAAEDGLLVNRSNESNPFYEITKQGEDYLASELDENDMAEPG